MDQIIFRYSQAIDRLEITITGRPGVPELSAYPFSSRAERIDHQTSLVQIDHALENHRGRLQSLDEDSPDATLIREVLSHFERLGRTLRLAGVETPTDGHAIVVGVDGSGESVSVTFSPDGETEATERIADIYVSRTPSGRIQKVDVIIEDGRVDLGNDEDAINLPELRIARAAVRFAFGRG